MARLISEVVERWCCSPEDLAKDEVETELIHPNQPPSSWNVPRYMVCRHCGQRFEYHAFTDAAGSSDWNYREIP